VNAQTHPCKMRKDGARLPGGQAPVGLRSDYLLETLPFTENPMNVHRERNDTD
jgi:hypothetical protein